MVGTRRIICDQNTKPMQNKHVFNNKKTPYGRFFNKAADLKFFKPFGYKAIIYIPIDNITKPETTADRGVSMGMSEGLLCYKIYCESTKSTVHSRDVTFIEEPGERSFSNDTHRGDKQTGNASTTSSVTRMKTPKTIVYRSVRKTAPKVMKKTEKLNDEVVHMSEGRDPELAAV